MFFPFSGYEWIDMRKLLCNEAYYMLFNFYYLIELNNERIDFSKSLTNQVYIWSIVWYKTREVLSSHKIFLFFNSKY